MQTTTGCKYIDQYVDLILSNKVPSGKRLKKAIHYILKKLDDDDIFIDTKQTEKAKELIESHFGFELLPWELFVLGLIHCFYKSLDAVVFRKFLIIMGRGNGKNGFISALSWYFTTPTHGIRDYHVDIVSNSEDQARTSFDEVYEILEADKGKFRRFFYWSKTIIRNLKTRSWIKYHTSNAKTKEGKRTACLILDEIDMYESDEIVKSLEGGLGKKKYARMFEITTQGDVREGYLDAELDMADMILDGEIEDSRMLPLIWEIDEEKQGLDPDLWEMANPSLPYFPELQLEMKENFAEMAVSSTREEMFFTKRMNFPKMDREKTVASREDLRATNQEIPELEGRSCILGIDYALLSDMASAGLLFRVGNKRVWIQHSWICSQSSDWSRIRIKEQMGRWQDRGHMTIVDDAQIDPRLITAWIAEQMKKYHIIKLALDHARFALLREPLQEIGFFHDKNKDKSNIWFVRPLGIASVSPVIESLFVNQDIIWGDVPVMRWAANNTKRVRMNREGMSGNYRYDKIEPRSRKTDPFMAFVHAMVLDEELDSPDIEGILQMAPWVF